MSWASRSINGGWGGVGELGGGGGWRKGPWTAEEDKLLTEYVRLHGDGRWNSVSRLTGLQRNGKSCRLRWVNYLRPDLKRGEITPHEETIILELHARWGNRWSTIARSLPGRTDNEIKNYWRTHFKNKSKIPPPNNKSERAKTRILKRQHFQRQQQQQKQKSQQNHVNIEKIMSMLQDETNNNNNRVHYIPQQDQAGPSYYTISDSGTNTIVPPVPEASDDDFLWDGLWNLDDLYGTPNNFGVACATSKACSQDLTAPFCLGSLSMS